MFPELFHIGPVTLHTYGLMVALGILFGVTLAEYLHRKSGGEPGRIVDMALMVVVIGLIGARLMFIWTNLDYYLQNPLETMMLWKGGLVFYGALAGGILAILVVGRYYRLPFLYTLDIGSPALALAHATGRLGCFSAGCCYGRPADIPWGVTFKDPRCLAGPVLNRSVHPTQIYSFLFLIVLTVFLVRLHSRKRFEGQVTALYIGLYSIFRFFIEFFRGDPRGGIELGAFQFSTSQVISLCLLPCAAAAYFLLSRKVRAKESRKQLED